MKRAAFGVLALLACRSLCACAPEAAASDPNLESLCGPGSKLRDVEFYQGELGVPSSFVNRHRLAVGLLRWKDDLRKRYLNEAGTVEGDAWCTGTLIDDDLFLTAGHCLDPNDSGGALLPREKGGVLLRPEEMAREFVVDFRYEKSADPSQPTPVKRVEVVRLEERGKAGLDYAILRLAERAGVQNGVARISPSDAAAGSRIAILQHPIGMPMMISAGTALRVQGSTIAYDTVDTEHGSSGSGILDAETGKLIGVHTTGGCTRDGRGENSGVAIGALTAASPILSGLVDRSRDFMVGDWDNDGRGDLAVFDQGCLYPDADHNEVRDAGVHFCPADPNADEYFVGNWRPGSASELAWRLGDCVYFDSDPRRPLCFDGAPFEVMIADWSGDGQSDLGIRKGSCIDFDTNLDGLLDDRGYCYGDGYGEDEYLVGNWDGPRASVATRKGNTLAFDLDRDGNSDFTRIYGEGGSDDQYLVADWNGDRRADLAVRTKGVCQMNHDAVTGANVDARAYRDFWSQP